MDSQAIAHRWLRISPIWHDSLNLLFITWEYDDENPISQSVQSKTLCIIFSFSYYYVQIQIRQLLFSLKEKGVRLEEMASLSSSCSQKLIYQYSLTKTLFSFFPPYTQKFLHSCSVSNEAEDNNISSVLRDNSALCNESNLVTRFIVDVVLSSVIFLTVLQS